MTQTIDLAAAAQRHGLSEEAAQVLYDALVSGGGRMAQFSHRDLGGMGQWSGGMTQIGDMFNDGLKARVSAFCADMAAEAGAATNSGAAGHRQLQNDGSRLASASPWAQPRNWWPPHLGAPASSGSQNDMGYACFPDLHRLAILRNTKVTLYDTGSHRLTGFSQQQSQGSDLTFSGQHGAVALHSLQIVAS